MRKVVAGALAVALVASLFGIVACGSKGSGTAPVTSPAPAQDYVVKVTVEPEQVTIPRAGGEDVEVVYTISNEGAKADTYSLQFTAFGVKWVPEGIPTTMDVAAGEKKDVSVPLAFDISGTTPGFDVALTATSQGDSATTGRAACSISFE